jgi:signal transduction histidine kinase
VNRVGERLRSLPITTQIAMLVAAALVIAHVLIAVAVFRLYSPLDPMSSPGMILFRLDNLARRLDAASSPDQRAAIMRTAHEEIAGLEVGDLPKHARNVLLGPGPDDVQSHLGDRFKAFDIPPDEPAGRPRIAIQLSDGSVVMAPFGPPPPFSGGRAVRMSIAPPPPFPGGGAVGESVAPPPPFPGHHAVRVSFGPLPFPFPGLELTVAVVFLASAVILLSIWATRMLTAPLTRFTEAAERFTLGRTDAPLPERGPKEIVRAARAFNGMRERIQRMVEERAHMLAAVSHDLRTPITRLRLRAEDIEQLSLKTQVIRDLDTMRDRVHAALSFLRDHASRCKHERIDLPSLIQTVCDDCADAGRDIAFEGPSHLYVDGDPDQLARALTNLIENGLRFGTTVTVSLRTAQDGTAEIDVRDDGPGIPDGEKRRVLEPFYRCDRARSLDNHDGFGLGLSISQVIAEAHSGLLSLHDAAPTGLIARLTLLQAGLPANDRG